jgi:hypothetical protein
MIQERQYRTGGLRVRVRTCSLIDQDRSGPIHGTMHSPVVRMSLSTITLPFLLPTITPPVYHDAPCSRTIHVTDRSDALVPS